MGQAFCEAFDSGFGSVVRCVAPEEVRQFLRSSLIGMRRVRGIGNSLFGSSIDDNCLILLMQHRLERMQRIRTN